MPNNKSYKLNTAIMPNNKSYKLNITIMPNNNEKRDYDTVLVMVLKSFKQFFNGSTMISKI